MEKILIGKIIRPFGIRGECKIISYSDFDLERYQKDSLIYLYDSKEYKAYKVINYRKDSKGIYLKLDNINNMNDAEKLRDYEIYKDKSDIKPLAEGKYYFSDLMDLDIYVDNKLKATVKNVEEGVACNYLRVSTIDKKEKLIPFIPYFILNVDLNNKRIDIINLDGLL